MSLQGMLERFRELMHADYLGMLTYRTGEIEEVACAGPAGAFSKKIALAALLRPISRDVEESDATASAQGAEYVFVVPFDEDTLLYAWWTRRKDVPQARHLETLSQALRLIFAGSRQRQSTRQGLKTVHFLQAYFPDVRVLATDYGQLIYRSTALQELVDFLANYVEDETLLFSGETGTGKTLLASVVHTLSRREGDFVHISVTEFPGSLFQIALFGAVAGAYTGADQDRVGFLRLAHGGTLFLDEIAELPDEIQAVILRVMETNIYYPVGSTDKHHADVRWLFATTHKARIRRELLNRCAAEIPIPPLRDRREDILPIFYAYAEMEPEPSVHEFLLEYPWPGNVRQLMLVARQAAKMARRQEVSRIPQELIDQVLRFSPMR